MTTCCSKDMLFTSRTVMLLGSVRSTDTGSVSSGERTSSFAPKGAEMVFKVSGLCKQVGQKLRTETWCCTLIRLGMRPSLMLVDWTCCVCVVQQGIR